MSADTLQAAYALTEALTPLSVDCGQVCGGRCCRPHEGGRDGMRLLPGEAAFLAQRAAGCGTTLALAGLSVRPAADGADLLICTGRCDRRLRPLSCRIYPLYPQVGTDGRVRARYDPRAWAQCPLSHEQAHVRLQPTFVRAVRRIGRLLQDDPDTAPALRAQSDELTALSALLPQGGRPPIARRSPLG